MDLTYLLLLQNIREAFGGVFDSYMLKITSFAESFPTFLLLAGVYWCVDKRAGQCMGWNTALACTWSQFLKAVCKIDRPWVRDERIRPVEAAVLAASGYSFPSGHTARAVASWGVLGSCMLKRGKADRDQSRKWLGMLSWVLTALILFSRNYLGVHTPQDVLAALFLGLALIWGAEKLLDWVEGHPDKDLLVCGMGCLLCFLPMLRVGCMPNAGAGMGLLLGWLAERRLVRFDTAGPAGRRCVRFFAGSGFALFLLEVTRSALGLLMAGKYAGFFSMFLFTFFVMAGYPYLFCRFQEQEKMREGRWGSSKAGAGVLSIFLCVLLVLSSAGMQLEQAGQKGAGNGSMSESTDSQTNADSPADGNSRTNAGSPADANNPADAGCQSVGNSQADTGSVQESPETAPGNGGNGNQADANAAGLPHGFSGENRAVTKIIAHRGYSSVLPENTLAAFAGALDLGVDYIETDVQMTKDGRIVVFHDSDLKRITGCEGTAADYTYEELRAMDAGKWFADSFAGERIPALRELLALVRDSDAGIYLELKDIGDAEGFAEAVYAEVREAGMAKRCVFASFRYDYLMRIKEADPDCQVLYNTFCGTSRLPEEYPADFYGISAETVNAGVIEAVHAQSGQVFVWTVDAPQQMKNLRAMGADGIVTNRPGLAKVIVRPEYVFLADHFEQSMTVPGLYEKGLNGRYDDMVVQGLAKTADRLVVSAYSFSGTLNSILWVMDLDGNLLHITDLGFRAHTGGIAYDEAHDLLWVTGPEGKVYGLSWTEIQNGTYKGGIQVSFDAGLFNHNGAKVASFLTIDEGELYVGSYVDGANGQLNRYSLEDVLHPVLLSVAVIPQRIQGVTFQRDITQDRRYMLLSQGYQMEDAYLLRFVYEEDAASYEVPAESWLMPEGTEQILMTSRGLYVLFESAAKVYRETARVRNDQIYIIRM